MSSAFWNTVSNLRGAKYAPAVATAAQQRPPAAAAAAPPASAALFGSAKKGTGVGRGGARPGAGRPKKAPSAIGVDVSQYGTVKDVEQQMAALRAAKRALVTRAADTAVLAAPGSLGAPTVGAVSSNADTPAEISASSNLVGQTSGSPDPRTEAAAKHGRDTTTAAAVAPENVGLNAPAFAGQAAAVPTSYTPAGPAQLAAAEGSNAAASTRNLFRIRS